jgi:glycosyltransferase involved in cell wall biosynthesis
VRALARTAGVADALVSVGFIRDMRAAYAGADVLLFPTRFDTWGLPVVEALSCGTPVVVSAHAGAATVVHPGRNGAVLTDPTDPIAVAFAALDVLERRHDRDALRAGIEHLSWDRIVAELETIVEATAS